MPTYPAECFNPTLWNIVYHSVNNHNLSMMYENRPLLFLIHAFLNDCPYPVVYRLRSGLLGGCMSGVKSGVLCHSTSVLLRLRGALESKSNQQLDRCLAATVWAAIHHSNSPMPHSLSPLAAWKPHQCTSAWRYRVKPKRRNMFIRNQRGMSMSWNGIWLKYGQQPAELHWSIHRSMTRLFIACFKAKSKHLEHLLWCVPLRYVP